MVRERSESFLCSEWTAPDDGMEMRYPVTFQLAQLAVLSRRGNPVDDAAVLVPMSAKGRHRVGEPVMTEAKVDTSPSRDVIT
jgi:hypothetical protein